MSPPAGAGPRHLAFHPSDKWAFGINELASSMTTYAATTRPPEGFTPQATVSTLPAGTTTPTPVPRSQCIRAAATVPRPPIAVWMRFAIFVVDAATGALTFIGKRADSRPRFRGAGIDDSGTLLVVANQRTAATPNQGNLVVFKIGAGGALTMVGTPIVGVGSPAFVGLFRF